ncbi:MAG: Uma2 family endonuclease [Planctomycetes bacterium]|nr:Uma2 family endonuclease [Planctomycetota bacterium]
MATDVIAPEQVAAPYGGVRMTAEEFFNLPDDGYRYELVDGVVLATPSPSPRHQRVAHELTVQLASFLKAHPVGEMLYETDVHLGRGPDGTDLVYCPEIVFYRADRLAAMRDRLVGPPDLVVEVISPLTRRYDTQTKRDDYQRFGVREYWIVDAQRNEFIFLRNEGDAFVQVPPTGDTFASQAVEGFVLDLTQVRATFGPWS